MARFLVHAEKVEILKNTRYRCRNAHKVIEVSL